MSWIRKSREDIEKEKKRKRFSLSFPIIVFITIVSLWLIRGISGYRGWSHPSGTPWSWEDFLTQIPEILLVSSVVSFVVWLMQILIGMPFYWLLEMILTDSKPWQHGKIVICEKCGKTRYENQNDACACGGKYHALDKMKWVDD